MHNDNYKRLSGWSFYNTAPEGIAEILRVSNRGVWVRGHSGKKYLVPHHAKGEAMAGELRAEKDW